MHAGDMEIAEYDSAGTLLRRYIPGGAVDQRVAMIEGSGSCAIGSSGCPDASAFSANDIRYYHADRLGNVAALTDGTGRVTDRYAYDPFGNEITGAPTSGNPFRYTGRRYDPETGLYFYRARYYDAPLGRFLQTDPIGYADQWNLYTYVGNDPLNATDPSGLYQCSNGSNSDGNQIIVECDSEVVDSITRIRDAADNSSNPEASSVLGEIADFYGDANVDNGVIVQVVEVVEGAGATYHNDGTNHIIRVPPSAFGRVDAYESQVALPGYFVHEGSHGVQRVNGVPYDENTTTAFNNEFSASLATALFNQYMNPKVGVFVDSFVDYDGSIRKDKLELKAMRSVRNYCNRATIPGC